MAQAENNGVQLHYEDVGQGPAIVLLHNLGGSHALWQTQLTELATTNRVLAMDLRGHGHSSSVQGDIRFEDLVSDVLAVLDAAGESPATVVGVSLGGMIALRVAVAAPERVSGVVLISTDAGVPSLASRTKLALLRAALFLFGRRVLRSAVSSMVGATTLRERRHLLVNIAKGFALAHLRSLRALTRMLGRRRALGPALRELTVPAAIILGEEDTTLPPARARLLLMDLPGATLLEIAGAGHLTPLETPDQVTAVIRTLAAG